MWRNLALAVSRMHVVLDQRRVRYVLVSTDEVRRFAPLPRTVYLLSSRYTVTVSIRAYRYTG